MARTIGKTKSWLWWIVGALCALVLGSGPASGGEVTRKYGVRPRPPVRDLQPEYGVIRRPIPPVITKQVQAKQLIAQYETQHAALSQILKNGINDENKDKVKELRQQLVQSVEKLKALGTFGRQVVTLKINEQSAVRGQAQKKLAEAVKAGDEEAAAKAKAEMQAAGVKLAVLSRLFRAISPPPPLQTLYGVRPRPVPPPKVQPLK